jgi:hypothetical protein
MSSSLADKARQRPAVERITWDPASRVWRWWISAETPSGQIVRTGTALTRREAHQALTVEWSRLTRARALGDAVAPQLRLAGRKGRPPRPQLRGPGLA